MARPQGALARSQQQRSACQAWQPAGLAPAAAGAERVAILMAFTWPWRWAAELCLQESATVAEFQRQLLHGEYAMDACQGKQHCLRSCSQSTVHSVLLM